MQKQHLSLPRVLWATITLFVLVSISCSVFSRETAPTPPPELEENIIPTLPPEAPPAETGGGRLYERRRRGAGGLRQHLQPDHHHLPALRVDPG